MLTGIQDSVLHGVLCVQYTCPIDELQSIKWISTKEDNQKLKKMHLIWTTKKSVMILRCRDEFIEINFCLLECTPVHCTVHTGVFEKKLRWMDCLMSKGLAYN